MTTPRSDHPYAALLSIPATDRQSSNEATLGESLVGQIQRDAAAQEAAKHAKHEESVISEVTRIRRMTAANRGQTYTYQREHSAATATWTRKADALAGFEARQRTQTFDLFLNCALAGAGGFLIVKTLEHFFGGKK